MMRKREIGLSVLSITAMLTVVGCGAMVGTLEPHRFSAVPAGHTEATVYYPKGDVTESVLMLRTTGPKTVRAGEMFEYKIELYNPTDRTIVKNIVVSDYLSPEYELVRSTPSWTDLNRFERKTKLASDLRQPHEDFDSSRKSAPDMARARYVSCEQPAEADLVQWYIEELYPEKLVTIRVNGRAKSEGHWKSCATASYDLGACMAAKVVSPELKLVAHLEREFVLCDTDQTDLRMQVRNAGSGKTEDVTVTAALPPGMTYKGSRAITERVGKLPPGESKTIRKSLHVERPGTYKVQAKAKSRSGLSTDAASVVLRAHEPDIEIEVLGPDEEYVGLPVEYEIRVSNVGDVSAKDLVIENAVPSGAEFVDATNKGKLRGNTVRWHLDELPAGKYVPLSVRFKGTDKGYLRSVVTARSECSMDVTAIARTELEGVASMVVEVVDTQDPIRVGSEEVYEIRVHNQGSAPETDVMVTCEVPDGQQFVSASGSTKVKSSSKTIVFHPVKRLGPDDTARWKVRVRGIRSGDMRFRVAVDSDQHGRPVRETEATRVFD